MVKQDRLRIAFAGPPRRQKYCIEKLEHRMIPLYMIENFDPIPGMNFEGVFHIDEHRAIEEDRDK